MCQDLGLTMHMQPAVATIARHHSEQRPGAQDEEAGKEHLRP